MLEEILGYVLESLEFIEIPAEPPEQAGACYFLSIHRLISMID